MSQKRSFDDIQIPSYDETIAADRALLSHAEVEEGLRNLVSHLSDWEQQGLQELQKGDNEALDYLIPRAKEFLDEFSQTGLPHATFLMIPSEAVQFPSRPVR
jgi:hypothetical protein